MKISKNNWFARYYNWMYDELPNDICTFFWGSVLIIALFPLFVPGRIVGRNEYGLRPGEGLGFWIVYLILMIIGGGMTYKLGYEYTHWIGLVLLAPLTGLLIIGIIFGGIAGIVYLLKKTGGKVGQQVSKISSTQVAENVSSFVGAVRKKHCTKIDWK